MIVKYKGRGLIHPPAKEGDAGFDICCYEPFNLGQGKQKEVSTDIFLEIPPGYVGFIKEKSGLSRKGIQIGAGVIDSGYRGEVIIVIRNVGDKATHFNKDRKIAQIIFLQVPPVALEKVDSLTPSIRDKSGFGSSGE